MGRPFIAIEGVIGIGKTTLANKIGEVLGYDVIKEPVETNPYLSLFYSDMQRWGATMQYHLLAARYILHHRAMASPRGVVQDRSIYGDTVFARNLQASSLMTELEFQTYQLLWESKRVHLVYPDLMIFLFAPLSIVTARIAQRGRVCEQAISESYLIELDAWYHVLYDELRSSTRCICFDWIDPNMNVKSVIDAILHVDNDTGFSWQRRRPTLLP